MVRVSQSVDDVNGWCHSIKYMATQQIMKHLFDTVNNRILSNHIIGFGVNFVQCLSPKVINIVTTTREEYYKLAFSMPSSIWHKLIIGAKSRILNAFHIQ